MSQVTKRGAKAPEMNMTPLIDVTFQLILFFMLVNNIIAEESLPMIVPKLENPQVRELGEDERIVINVAGIEDTVGGGRINNPYDWNGGRIARLRIGMDTFNFERGEVTLPEALKFVTDTLKESVKDNKDVHVVLRADVALHYQEVQQVIEAITQAEVKKLNVVAYIEGQDE